jgi:hypothetical protein
MAGANVFAVSAGKGGDVAACEGASPETISGAVEYE